MIKTSANHLPIAVHGIKGILRWVVYRLHINQQTGEETMLSWRKRLIYSFMSVVATGSVCGAIVLFPRFGQAAWPHSGIAIFGMFLFFELFVVTLTFPCWLVAAPIILIATDIRGWRFWLYWAIGSLIGPLYWFGRKVMGFDTNRKLHGGPYGVIVVVSVLASLIYLLVIRRAQEPRISN